jgi:hypothetical protein
VPHVRILGRGIPQISIDSVVGTIGVRRNRPRLEQKQERCGFDEFHEVAFFLMKKAIRGSGLGISILFLP